MANAKEEGDTGRLQPHVEGKMSKSKDTVVSTLLQRSKGITRRLKSKRPNTTATLQQHPPDPNVLVEKKKLDGFLQKTQYNLTISTTASTRSSSPGRSHDNYSFDYPIARWPSQQTSISSDSGSGSMDESLATFGTSSKVPDDADLLKEGYQLDANFFKEWLQLFKSRSAETSAKEANEAMKLLVHPVKATSRHSNEEVIIEGCPSDLLSAQYTLESSTDTMSTVHHRISTPLATTSASCSFNFTPNFFGVEMLKSVANKTVHQNKAQRKNGSGVNDEDADSRDDKSRSTLYSI